MVREELASVIMRVSDLKKYFRAGKKFIKAVDGVSLCLEKGKTLAVVGETGCGKTTLGKMVLRLLEPTSGSIYFENFNLLSLSRPELKKWRRKAQMIFQDPSTSLNHRMNLTSLIVEPLLIHNLKATSSIVEEILTQVGLDVSCRFSYPHELSGGQKQRAAIARALILNPKFLVCDEPVSALDLSLQIQITNLLQELQRVRGLTYLFISHDLRVVGCMSHTVAVMYAGRVVESGPTRELYRNPLHPYTQLLWSAIPQPDSNRYRYHSVSSSFSVDQLEGLRNKIPSKGCPYAFRCPKATAICRETEPISKEILPSHWVTCHHTAD